jgi:cytochrome c oxidase subunit 3
MTRQLPLSVDAVTLREDQVRLGLWMFLATVTMLFAAFTSAYIVRRSGSDWHAIALPPILWLNTAILGASSVGLEWAERSGRGNRWTRASVASAGSVLLGVAFVCGQVVAWRQLAAAGVYLPSNPYSSFFYMLTAAHALHVVAALCVLTWSASATGDARRDVRAWRHRMEVGRTFWHYLGLIWVFLFLLMTLV